MKHSWKPAVVVAAILATGFMPLRTFGAATIGAELYKSKCASCHGPDGAGHTTMGKVLKLRDLGSADVQKQSDDELSRITTKGKGKMPAFDGKLKKEQIGEVVGYIRALGKGK